MVSPCHEETMFQGSHGLPTGGLGNITTRLIPRGAMLEKRGDWGTKSLTEVGSKEMRRENGDREYMIFFPTVV